MCKSTGKLSHHINYSIRVVFHGSLTKTKIPYRAPAPQPYTSDYWLLNTRGNLLTVDCLSEDSFLVGGSDNGQLELVLVSSNWLTLFWLWLRLLIRMISIIVMRNTKVLFGVVVVMRRLALIVIVPISHTLHKESTLRIHWFPHHTFLPPRHTNKNRFADYRL